MLSRASTTSLTRRWARAGIFDASNAIAGPSRLPLHLISRGQSTAASSRPLKVAIIGSGPSGFYTASRILDSVPLDSPDGKDVEVHMYERLPTPYGLVRYGVAPDHPDVKNCQHKFDDLSLDPRFSFFGNVNIGSPPSSTPDQPTPPTTLSTYTYPHALHLPLASLLPFYSTLILTYGASLSNPLSSVPGSSSSSSPLGNVFPALAFVSWYNGHPAFSDLPVDLRGIREVEVVGQGNVALDVARFLLKGEKELRGFDVPEEVLEVLSKSDVESVRLVGRRGPGQVAFTTKEFREMVNLPNVEWAGVQGGLMEDAKALVKGDRMRTRLLGLMEKPIPALTEGDKKHFSLEFLRSPKAFRGEDGKVQEVEWEINELLVPPSTPSPPPSQAPAVPSPAATTRPTGKTETRNTDMVIESVGYRSEPLLGKGWELPFDLGRGRVKNQGGRVVDPSGTAIPNVYAAGWVARGPVGVIASTMHDAYSLAGSVLDDHFSSPSAGTAGPLASAPEPGPPPEVVRGLKDEQVVDLKRWNRIDAAEVERGKPKGKEREKFRTVEEMLAV